MIPIFIKRLAILDVGAKVLTILLLVVQAVLLNIFFIKFDSNAGKYAWFVGDGIVLIIWIAGLVLVSRTGNPKQKTDTVEETGARKWLTFCMGEVQYAYFSWILYSIVVTAKIWYMFGDFAENLSTLGYYNMTTRTIGGILKFEDSILYSSTSMKVILSISGPLFLLLAYSHHDEVHNSKYKLLMEKLGTTASMDILDCLMLLALLFIDDTLLVLPYSLDHAIKFFTCCCFALPTLPLFILRLLGKRKAEENNFKVILAINSGLYLVIVNVPLLIIRCFLWFRHDVDISTFVTKNVMSLVRCGLDVYNEVRQWLKTKQGAVPAEPSDLADQDIELKDQPARV
ncbi:uncharacterized protein [Diadema antillarum]|uniref:uncharacterized protein n=1 Tax=Diadema antillarum TaxID=105358 RepID=UPI003A851CE8